MRTEEERELCMGHTAYSANSTETYKETRGEDLDKESREVWHKTLDNNHIMENYIFPHY